MTTFQFRLEPVLEHKRRLEEAAQAEHGRRLATQRREEDALARLAEAEARTVGDLERQRRTGRLAIELLQMSLTLQEALQVQLTRQETAVTQARQEATTTREALLSRVQERKILEGLRERQLTDFALAQQRAETRQIDELVTGRAARALIAARRPSEYSHAS